MSIEEIYQEMVQDVQRETGLTLAGDGDMAVRLYAVAAQVYGLYVQADWVGRQCFPQTAQGEFLDRHAQLRGVGRLRRPRGFFASSGTALRRRICSLERGPCA